MSFQLVHFSDCGGYRPTNQDGYCIRARLTSAGVVAMLAVCDGMGGMNSGEIASSTVIDALGRWFDRFSPVLTSKQLTPECISRELHSIVKDSHQVIRQYGLQRGWHIGTTLSVILLNYFHYFLLHVGDSRIYLTDPWHTQQLTQDQTLAMRELEAGRITKEEYSCDLRRNVLLQCVGDRSVCPVFLTGNTPSEGGVLLCSDGFYHTTELQELHNSMRQPGDRDALRQCLLSLANRARTMGETDNMTCVAFRWTENAMWMERRSNTNVSDSLASISFINGGPLGVEDTAL